MAARFELKRSAADSKRSVVARRRHQVPAWSRLDGAAHGALRRGPRSPQRKQYLSGLVAAARRYSVPPALIACAVLQEVGSSEVQEVVLQNQHSHWVEQMGYVRSQVSDALS